MVYKYLGCHLCHEGEYKKNTKPKTCDLQRNRMRNLDLCGLKRKTLNINKHYHPTCGLMIPSPIDGVNTLTSIAKKHILLKCR